MAISQNLKWSAPTPAADSSELRPGRSISTQLRQRLRGAGWDVSELDNWRDVGWALAVRKGEAALAITLARLSESSWMLQIAPERVVGVIGRIMGRANSASPSDVGALAGDVHSAMTELVGPGSLRWRWDGMPGDNDGDSVPTLV